MEQIRYMPPIVYRRAPKSNRFVSTETPSAPVGFPWEAIHDAVDVIVFVRGLPGVGKTTFAHSRFSGRTLFEADLFLTDPSIRGVKERHKACQQALKSHVSALGPAVIICNTFSQAWELQEYLDVLPPQLNGRFLLPLVFHLHSGELSDAILAERTRHGVPVKAIFEMRYRWEAWPGEYLIQYGAAVSR